LRIDELHDDVKVMQVVAVVVVAEAAMLVRWWTSGSNFFLSLFLYIYTDNSSSVSSST